MYFITVMVFLAALVQTSLQFSPKRLEISTTRNLPAACYYDSEEEMRNINHKINTTSKRVSQIECEKNLWEYKYRVLQAHRKLIECEAALENYTSVLPGKPRVQQAFPHVGAVGWRRRFSTEDGIVNYSFKCGCTLISTRYALTAAHCKISREDENTQFVAPDIVRFGFNYPLESSQFYNTADSLETIDVGIENIYVLEKFNYTTAVYNNIALLKLREEVTISENIRPACLYSGTDFYYDRALNVTGWGTIQKTGRPAEFPMVVPVHISNRNSCDAIYSEYVASYVGLHSYLFCAESDNNKDASCQIDAGAPVQFQKPLPKEIDDGGFSNYVVGVLTGGVRFGWEGPNIFTNITDNNIMCWIERHVWPETISASCVGSTFTGYDLFV